jgi:NADH dehydrogenase [ubiquinone] 1 alpha subcomplex assembly factor 5
MDSDNQPPEVFDRRRRRLLRQRAEARPTSSFLWNYIAGDLAERLAIVTRPFERVLFLGPIAGFAAKIMPNTDAEIVRASLMDSVATDTLDEDRLQFSAESFDLVVSAGTLDSVNDLPGALIQIRRILKPDGLFLGHIFGAGTLLTLKSAMLAAEQDVAAPHVHPQIDIRTAADLLTRAGFALPVADLDIMSVRYSDWRRLVGDIREAGLGNALTGPRKYMGRNVVPGLDLQWSARAAEDGRVDEQFVHVFMSGWAPAPHQPRPAQRGSGQVSLADFFPRAIKS